MVAWIPAAIAAASALGTSAISSSSQNRQISNSRIYNRSLSDQAFNKNLQMWYTGMDYNNPINQRARFKMAGLNPALAYGGSATQAGNVDQAPQLDYSGAQMDQRVNPNSAISSGLGLFSSAISAMVSRSQIDNLDAGAQKAAAEAAKIITEDKTLQAKLPYIVPQIQADLSQKMAQTNLYYKQADVCVKNLDLMASQINLNNENAASVRLARDIQEAAKDSIIESYSIKNDEALAHIRVLNKTLAKYDAEIENLKWATDYLYEEGKLAAETRNLTALEGKRVEAATRQIETTIGKIAAETNLTEKDVKYYVFNKTLPVINTTIQTAGNVAAGFIFKGAIGRNAGAAAAQKASDEWRKKFVQYGKSDVPPFIRGLE